MLKHIKRILFNVKSERNIFWDESEIDIGCELIIPDKYKGNTPLCVISHGSGGLGSDTELFVESLTHNGIACLCVDSFTGRNIASLNWDSGESSYISPKVRAYETMQAIRFMKSNEETMFMTIDFNRIAMVGFSWGADTIAHVIGTHSHELPTNTFYALVYGNLWPFENSFYKARDCDVTVYHGSEDNWTSSEKTKIFADQTNSKFVEFFGCSHGFCKYGYDKEKLNQVIINHNADFPIPTEMSQVYFWIQKGQIWKDTEWQKVDVEMSYDQMATEQIISDIIEKLS